MLQFQRTKLDLDSQGKFSSESVRIQVNVWSQMPSGQIWGRISEQHNPEDKHSLNYFVNKSANVAMWTLVI